MAAQPFNSAGRASQGRGTGSKLALLAIGVAIVATVLIWKFFFSSYHLATVQPGVLYRDGSRSVRELSAAVRKVHAKTVVSLIDENEVHDPSKPQFAQEQLYLADHSVGYQRIPVKLGGWPTSADVQTFLQTMDDPARQPVLLHCAQGVRRTAMFVAAYQESVLGYEKQKAKDAILSFGHSDKTIDDIVRFIDNYDPKTRTISPELYKINSGQHDNVEQDQHSP